MSRGRAQRERISSRLPAESRAQHGARSQDPEIITSAEIKSWTLNPLSHPGAPTKRLYDELLQMSPGWRMRPHLERGARGSLCG